MGIHQQAGIRRVVSVLTATTLGTVGLAALATTTSATETHQVDAIDKVAITHSESVSVDSTVRVDATWSVTNGEAKAGDTFSLELPTDPLFTGFSGEVDLQDPDDKSVGTCAATPTDITCTFDDYVETHNDVHGTLYMWATAKQETSQGTATFTTSGRTIDAEVPGGGVTPKTYEWPNKPLKTGKVDDGFASWSVLMPGASLLSNPGDLVITDTYDARLGALDAAPKVYWVTKEQWLGSNPWGQPQFLDSTQFTSVEDPASKKITTTINRDAIDPENLYILQYKNSLPSTPADGDVYTNHVEGTAWSADTTATKYGVGGEGKGIVPAGDVPPNPAPGDGGAVPGGKGAEAGNAAATPAPAGGDEAKAADARDAKPTSTATNTAGKKPSVLAHTGAQVAAVAGAALILVLGGAAVLVIRRRRASA